MNWNLSRVAGWWAATQAPASALPRRARDHGSCWRRRLNPPAARSGDSRSVARSADGRRESNRRRRSPCLRDNGSTAQRRRHRARTPCRNRAEPAGAGCGGAGLEFARSAPAAAGQRAARGQGRARSEAREMEVETRTYACPTPGAGAGDRSADEPGEELPPHRPDAGDGSRPGRTARRRSRRRRRKAGSAPDFGADLEPSSRRPVTAPDPRWILTPTWFRPGDGVRSDAGARSVCRRRSRRSIPAPEITPSRPRRRRGDSPEEEPAGTARGAGFSTPRRWLRSTSTRDSTAARRRSTSG